MNVGNTFFSDAITKALYNEQPDISKQPFAQRNRIADIAASALGIGIVLAFVSFKIGITVTVLSVVTLAAVYFHAMKNSQENEKAIRQELLPIGELLRTASKKETNPKMFIKRSGSKRIVTFWDSTYKDLLAEQKDTLSKILSISSILNFRYEALFDLDSQKLDRALTHEQAKDLLQKMNDFKYPENCTSVENESYDKIKTKAEGNVKKIEEAEKKLNDLNALVDKIDQEKLRLEKLGITFTN